MPPQDIADSNFEHMPRSEAQKPELDRRLAAY